MIGNVRLALCVLLSLLLFTRCKKDDTMPMPIAKFEVVSTGENYTVNFENLSKNAESYNWDFGDGLTSTEQSPEHIYKQQGTFEVKLTVSNSSGDDTYTHKLILESQDKTKVKLLEAESVTNAGFDMKWEIEEGRPGSSYETYVQISDKEDFSSFPEVYEGLSVNGNCSSEFIKIIPPHTSLWFRNLVPNKQYYFRLKLVYTFNGNTEDIFSESKSVSTLDMPVPTLELSEYAEATTYFSVNTSLDNFEGNFTNSPENELVFAFDEDFSNIFTPEKIESIFINTYYKEPGETIYVKSIYSYNGVSKSIVKSYSMSEVFSDAGNWKGNDAVAFNYNGMKYFGIGDKNGKRIVFQVANFNGIGEYPLEGDPDNTLEDTYAYYYNGSDNKEYILRHLSTGPLTLYIYKETDGEFYGRLGSSTDSNTYMSFKAEDGSSESVSGMIFKASKQ